MKKTKKGKRKKWVRELFRKREENGGFNNLIQEMEPIWSPSLGNFFQIFTFFFKF